MNGHNQWDAACWLKDVNAYLAFLSDICWKVVFSLVTRNMLPMHWVCLFSLSRIIAYDFSKYFNKINGRILFFRKNNGWLITYLSLPLRPRNRETEVLLFRGLKNAWMLKLKSMLNSFLDQKDCLYEFHKSKTVSHKFHLRVLGHSQHHIKETINI